MVGTRGTETIVLAIRIEDKDEEKHTFDATLNIVITRAKIPLIVPTGAFVVSLVITTTTKTHKRYFLEFDTLLLDATFDVGAIIGACVIESEALIKESDAAKSRWR